MTIATGTGAIMAGGGTFDVTFMGTGGHGGQGAHLTPDLTSLHLWGLVVVDGAAAR